MKFKRQAREPISLNVIPLIDIVFFLLLFVMVSTTFTKKTELSVKLPEASGQMQMQMPEAIEVVVTRMGEYSVNGQSLINDNFPTLKSAISQIANNDVKRPFVITADAHAPYEAVVRVMDAAGQLGLTNLSITTIKPKEEKE